MRWGRWGWIGWALIGAGVLAGTPLPTPLGAIGNYEIEIKKAERTLLLKDGPRIQRSYSIAYGRGGPGDKHQAGDDVTPVGSYRIVKIKNHSRFHIFLHLNYPNLKDAFLGLRDHVISEPQFFQILGTLRRQDIPLQNTPLGGAIGIHGIGEITEEKLEIHRTINWTKGCIALTNDEIDDLMHYIGVGTKVVINE
jgi:murein L,D-transpeptidase YafK